MGSFGEKMAIHCSFAHYQAPARQSCAFLLCSIHWASPRGPMEHHEARPFFLFVSGWTQCQVSLAMSCSRPSAFQSEHPLGTGKDMGNTCPNHLEIQFANSFKGENDLLRYCNYLLKKSVAVIVKHVQFWTNWGQFFQNRVCYYKCYYHSCDTCHLS